MSAPAALVLSCEHAGRDVPARYRSLFDGPAARVALNSHRGWDPGTAELGAALARTLHAPLVVQTVTRLLVECNRSEWHGSLWSEFSRHLPGEEKERLLAEVWRPHREAVRQAIGACPPGPVVHVGVHSFAPVWEGRPRATHIGLLHDPRREGEAALVAEWRAQLRTDPATAELAVHRNRPYRGWTDGLVTTLRADFPESRYLGVELEVSQALMPADARLTGALARTLAEAMRLVAG